MTDPFTVEDATGLAAEIQELSAEFDAQTIARHQLGGKKYGAAKFLTVDTIQEALDEIVDFANYARYSYIRLRMLQEAILHWADNEGVEFTEHDRGFIKAGDSTKPRKDPSQ